MAHGMSNKLISEKLEIPVKTIERILNEVNKKSNNKSQYFSPRIRLIVSLIAMDLFDYEADPKPRLIVELNDNLRKTLILCCMGFSNKAIAALFNLSEKAIELRFSQLFDYFNIDTKNQSVDNPRVFLYISAYCRDNFKNAQLKRLYKETQVDRLDEIFANPKPFLDKLEEEFKFVG
jgi:DNA-binding NarL/FixJ family response regulator